MMEEKLTFVADGIEYEIVDNSNVVVREIKRTGELFSVPSIVRSSDGNIYKIIGISEHLRGYVYQYDSPVLVISFDESSEIEEVPTSFMLCCQIRFHLPPNIKRICGDGAMKFKIDIVCGQGCKFVTVIKKYKIIMNNHPLEIVSYNENHSKVIIRETIRLVGSCSFQNSNSITSVIIPSSVEVIGIYAFIRCTNLCSISFKKNSKLRIIKHGAFTGLSIKKIKFPASVEIIDKFAFAFCENLTEISFDKESKLKKIRDYSFYFANIERVDFPPQLLKIKLNAFNKCENLSRISFPNDSNLRKIGKWAFSFTNIEKVDFPSSLEEIENSAFNMAECLEFITFPKDSKLKVIGNRAFSITSIEEVVIPSKEVQIGQHAFDNETSIRYKSNTE